MTTIVNRIGYTTTAACREMYPVIKQKARTQREWDILIGLNRSYKSRLIIPRLKAGAIELAVKEILEVCQDDGARVRIQRGLDYANSLPPL